MATQDYFDNLDDLKNELSKVGTYDNKTFNVTDKTTLTDSFIDKLAYTSALGEGDVAQFAQDLIRAIARETGAKSASIHDLYMAFGSGEVKGFTVPAINVRMITYDVARIIFRVAMRHDAGAFIFEIATSEQGYTDQQPTEYSASILAAAVKEGYEGPVFIQGDHYQFLSKRFAESKESEITRIKDVVKKSIDAEFYNIDIDGSTIVELDKETVEEQQKNNYDVTATLTEYIRELEPDGVTVSIGGEIGHIGGINSTVEDFEVFMDGYKERLKGKDLTQISKVSVQTGSSHGGVALPDGSLAEVNIDFNVLKDIAVSAREKYSIGGPVQHGASTLPDDLFHNFPTSNALEIHLATGFQNIFYDNLSEDLKEKMYDWIKSNLREEQKEDWSEEQFIYKLRKKALGKFKKELWNLPQEEKDLILAKLEKKFEFLFEQLNTFGTRKTVDQYV